MFAPNGLTKRSSQPLHGAHNFDMPRSLLKFAALLTVINGAELGLH